MTYRLLLDGGAVPWEAASYQDMTPRQRVRWLRSRPYTAARVDPVGLDAADRVRLRIAGRLPRLDTSQGIP